MKFNQKRLANRTSFEFGDRGLSYQVKDQRSEADFKLGYADIPFNKILFTEQNSWLRNVGILWGLIGIVQLIMHFIQASEGSLPLLWLVLGAGCLAAFFVMKTKFTIFETQKGRIFVIYDDQHDDIVKALEERRDAYFRAVFGEVDFENDPDSEYQKFEWLRDNDVISEDEFKSKVGQLRHASTALPPGSDGTVH